MATLDIFNSDAFSVQSLSAAVNEAPYAPGRIGSLGLFDESGITTTSMSIEKVAEGLSLVTASERGAIGDVTGADKRQFVNFPSVHLQTNAAILADEIQNIRAFGSESDEQMVQAIVQKRLDKMRRNMDATLEYQRIGAIKGQVLDSNGSTVLMDLFTQFGLTQDTVAMALTTNTTKVKTKIMSAIKLIEDQLGAAPIGGMRAFCGQAFWEELVEHDKVVAAYDRFQDGSFLRDDPRAAFTFGGVQWERYRGTVGGVDFVATDEAYLVPEGVPDMFITNFSPADYMETANTMGLPYYAKQELMRMGKGVELEAQSNPITICTRPKAVIKLTRI